MPSAVICLVLRREGSLYYTARDGLRLVLGRIGVYITRPICVRGREGAGGSFSDTSCLNLSGRTSAGESILQAPFWLLSLRLTAVTESLLHVPYRNLSRRKVVGEFVLHATCYNLPRGSSGAEPLSHARCCNFSRS